jgi:hypothetical protein
MKANVLQLLPRAPGTFDGVGDYALALARGLRDRHGINSVFIAQEGISQPEIESFRIFPLETSSSVRVVMDRCDGIILHYVNYGFQRRGVPIALVRFLKSLRQECGGTLLVIFHELFASGPPWRSEFWLQPLQKKIARDLARLADARIVSSESQRDQLERLSSGLGTVVQPVTSTWGEPQFGAARERDPHSWIICGGTALVERSLRSFLEIVDRVPPGFAPHKLRVIGGANNPHVRALLNAPSKLSAEYFPEIRPEAAAPLLSAAAFAWIDYFTTDKVPADVLLKSSTFLAFCAYGVVTVMPRISGRISIENDILPGPFTAAQIPRDHDDSATAIFDWYDRHASSATLTNTVAQQLKLA